MKLDSETISQNILPAIGLGASLLVLGTWGREIYLNRKVRKVTDSPNNRVKTSLALRRLKKTIPKDTYVATSPEERQRILDDIGLKDTRDDYHATWMTMTSPEGEDYPATFIYAPEDANGTVDYAGLKHEIGHALDHLNGRFGEQGRNIFSRAWHKVTDAARGMIDPDSTEALAPEISAWDNAGYAAGHPQREAALDTYRWEARTKLLQALLDPVSLIG